MSMLQKSRLKYAPLNILICKFQYSDYNIYFSIKQKALKEYNGQAIFSSQKNYIGGKGDNSFVTFDEDDKENMKFN